MHKRECVTPLTLGHFWVVAETFWVSPLLMHPASPPLPSHALLANSIEVQRCCLSNLCSPLLSAWRSPFCLWLSSLHRLNLRWDLLHKPSCPSRIGLPATAAIHSFTENSVRCWGVRNTWNDVTKMRSTNPPRWKNFECWLYNSCNFSMGFKFLKIEN